MTISTITKRKRETYTLKILMKKLIQKELGKLANNFIHLVKTIDERFNKTMVNFRTMDSVMYHSNNNMFHLAEWYANTNKTLFFILALLEDISINKSGIRSLEEVGNQ